MDGRRIGWRIAAVGAALALLPVPASAATTAPGDLADGRAWFDGEVIDLADGWGEARACLVWREAETVECFRTRREMASAAAVAAAEHEPEQAEPGFATLAATCTSWLYLHEHTHGGGRTLQFRDRGRWQNLAVWGFSNRTSSFRTGACGVAMASSTYGGGARYTGTTSAHHYAPTMVSGWDDRVSSIFIY